MNDSILLSLQDVYIIMLLNMVTYQCCVFTAG